MEFEKIQNIKSAVESFNNAKLYSMCDDATLFIQNKKTDAIYKIGFQESEEGKILLNTVNAQILSEKNKEEIVRPVDQFKQNCDIIAESIKNVFSENYEDAIVRLKDVIHTVPPVSEESIMEDIKKIEEENKENELTFEWIKEAFTDKIAKYEEEEKEFRKTFNLFDEEDDLISGEFPSMEDIKIGLKAMSENYEEFKSIASNFGEFKNQIHKVLKNESLVDMLLEGFDMTSDPKVHITKKLVRFNHEHKAGLDIVDSTKKLVGIFENNTTSPIEGAKSPVVFNMAADNKFQPKFFRFKMGIFTNEDVRVMMEEINFFITSYEALNEDDQLYLYGVKHQLEYMYHSGQINDHLIMEMIKDFNKKYAKDLSADYQDAAKQLAWKTKEQMKEGNAQGIAIGGATM